MKKVRKNYQVIKNEEKLSKSQYFFKQTTSMKNLIVHNKILSHAWTFAKTY